MTQIKKIKIKNFKKIKNLEFEPKKLNIILGKNNTGKSSVLEAIYLGLIGINHQDILHKYKIVSESPFERLFKFRTEPYHNILESNIDLFNNLRKNPFEIYLDLDENSGDYLLSPDKYDGNTILVKELSTNKIIRINKESIGGTKTKLNYVFLYSGLLKSLKIENFWHYLETNLTKDEFDAILKNISFFGIEDIRYSIFESNHKQETILTYREKNFPYLPIFQLGTGVLYSLIFSIFTSISDIFIFDDIETVFHPDLIENFINILLSTKTQFFFTTQNTDILNNLIEKTMDLLIVYLFENGDFHIYNGKEAQELLKIRGDLR